ncbi:hypothetical protein PV08_06572 [Exophiala spinifera]|uniref:Hydantoinase/oxoprolinase n=1 Tax=Exophiala spinifera TaxID=91928 RepID=A0A0D1ZUZ1_9EURO|nr:uncharacterized protein PV08_06572 [Exophiala spinifera]KIW16517.1 hypothetical protein PV08_06572 [Exophiala spinifera]
MARKMRVGVDVGGTNTDAVVLDPKRHAEQNRGVLATHKTPTTPDTTSGVESAIRAVLEISGVPPDQIASITIGTTAFLNAVIQRESRHLSRVAVLRLSRSFLRDVKPFSEWPRDLAAIIESYVGYVGGGLNIDGTEEASIDVNEVVRACSDIRTRKARAVVVAGVYSPIDTQFRQEEKVKEIILREIPGIDVVCSHEVANIGFLERENAAILNAAILRYARRTVRSFESAMGRLGMSRCPLYLTQNDGTLLDAAGAARTPIRTFSSGVTNSMRGAAHLSGHTLTGSSRISAIVVDIGGTTTDVGVLLPSGLPRQASAYSSVAEVKVNYSLPHLFSIGLGGGSIVSASSGDSVRVGPKSVGKDILTKALVFGGDITTATDIVVAAGNARVGSQNLVSHLDLNLVTQARLRIRRLLEEAVDTVKTSPAPLPVFLVGGGSILAPTDLAGASSVTIPPYHDVANAVGAACSKVGAQIDEIRDTSRQTHDQIVTEAKNRAIRKAVSLGAIEDSVYIAEIEVMPIPYLSNQSRVVIKAIGEVDLETNHPRPELQDDGDNSIGEAAELQPPSEVASVAELKRIDHDSYRPTIIRNTITGVLEWHLTSVDLDYIADGCYLLGCGGGGPPYAGKIQLQAMLSLGHTIRVIDSCSLSKTSTVYWGGRMGSPAAISERLQAHETVLAIRELMSYLHQDAFDAVMGLEIGGSNGLEPCLWGSSRFFDRPVVDADLMGRANPMCWQITLTVHRPGEFVPCAIDSGTGRTMLMTRAPRDEDVDKPLRGAITELGSLVGLAGRPTTGEIVQKYAVLNTVSLAWRIGRAMARADSSNTISLVAERIVEEVGGPRSAKILYRGKITSIERTLHKGLSVGVLHITGGGLIEAETGYTSQGYTDGTLRIPFINENIYAEHAGADGSTEVLASVPDLITVIDKQSGRAVGVPEYRYGCHVIVLAIACSPRWTETPRGLEVGGPKSYGYDNIQYHPVGEYSQPKSVIEEYGSLDCA